MPENLQSKANQLKPTKFENSTRDKVIKLNYQIFN